MYASQSDESSQGKENGDSKPRGPTCNYNCDEKDDDKNLKKSHSLNKQILKVIQIESLIWKQKTKHQSGRI